MNKQFSIFLPRRQAGNFSAKGGSASGGQFPIRFQPSYRLIKTSKKAGLTLIELMIYFSITAFVLVVVIDLVAHISQNQKANAGQSEVVANSRLVTERISLSLRGAKEITGVYPSDELNLTIDSSQATFSLKDGQFVYAENLGPEAPLTNSLVEISPINSGESIFNKISTDKYQSVQIRFKIKYKNSNFFQDFQTTLFARGK